MSSIAQGKLELLIRIVEELNRIQDARDLIRILINRALEFTDAERGFLIRKEETGELNYFNDQGELIENPELSLSSISTVLSSGQSLCLIENADGVSIPTSASILALDLKTIMCAPLTTSQNTTFAVLYVDSRIVSRPFDRKDLDFFEVLSRHASVVWEHLRLNQQIQRDYKLLKEEVQSKYDYHQIVGQCHAMQEVYRTLEVLRDTNLDVMISGDTGTGKELIAKAIHYASPRAGAPLKQINCAALPEGLVEAELFGVEKNVATEVRSRQGKMEQAHGGTLFLDEIGDMPIRVQNRLLRFLDERRFRRIGGREEVSADVRVLAATNRDLETEIKAGRFRDALRYRLDVVTIHLPPLKDRESDLNLLVEFFLKEIVEKHGLDIKGLTNDAWQQIREYSWPGNIRELKYKIQSAAFLARGQLIDRPDLGFKTESAFAGFPTMDQRKVTLEKEMIRKSLILHRGNHVKIAGVLGIAVSTLRKKISAHELTG